MMKTESDSSDRTVMGTEKVGTRRLYRSLGIKLNEKEPIQMEFDLSEEGQSAWIYLGSRPRFNVVYATSDPYLIPGEDCSSRLESNKDPDKTLHSGSQFVEIAIFEQVEIPQELSVRFRKKDQAAVQKILAIAETLHPKQSKILDFFAGLIGLRFHNQLVLEQLHQSPIGLRGDDWVHGMGAPWIKVLCGGGLTPEGVDALINALGRTKQFPLSAMQEGGEVLFWLLRAWATSDPHSKFMMLFIPLEMILRGVRAERSEAENPLIIRLRELVEQHEEDMIPDLSAFLEKAISKLNPSLNDRFEILAKVSEGERCEQDIIAFRKFNRIRNRLLHGGEIDISLNVNLGQQVQPLEDLVGRYVSKTLFGDWIIYPSLWRNSQVQQKDPPNDSETLQ